MTKSKTANRYSRDVRARAVLMVFEHHASYDTQAGTIAAIPPKIGCIRQTLREWVKQAEKDSGMRDGVTTEEPDRIKPWNLRFESCGRRMKFCARRWLILRRPLSRFEDKPLPVARQGIEDARERGTGSSTAH